MNRTAPRGGAVRSCPQSGGPAQALRAYYRPRAVSAPRIPVNNTSVGAGNESNTAGIGSTRAAQRLFEQRVTHRSLQNCFDTQANRPREVFSRCSKLRVFARQEQHRYERQVSRDPPQRLIVPAFEEPEVNNDTGRLKASDYGLEVLDVCRRVQVAIETVRKSGTLIAYEGVPFEDHHPTSLGALVLPHLAFCPCRACHGDRHFRTPRRRTPRAASGCD